MESTSNANITLFFEQYKLLVEMADRVSERRDKMNNFYLTLNSVLFSAVLALSSNFDEKVMVFLCVLGFFISIIWFGNIKTYKKLNGAKFKVIIELEKSLPFQSFADEWKELKEGKEARFYRPLSDVEKNVPICFCCAYVILFAVFVIRTCNL